MWARLTQTWGGRRESKRSFRGTRKLATRRFRIWEGRGDETATDTEMRDSTVNKVRRNIDKGGGGEIEVLQALSLLALIATDRAKSRIWKNGNVPSVQKKPYRKMADPTK